jgi:hypothetical protein
MDDFSIAGFEEPEEIRIQRLRQNLNSASQSAANINAQAVQASIEIGKEKTQYFEKIALGCGATVALMVSFVGAHAGILQPRWLLRSALIALVFGMVCGFLRNWLFQWYINSMWLKRALEAKCQRESARKELIETGTAFAQEDGKPIDVAHFVSDFTENEKQVKKKLATLGKMESRFFEGTRIIEILSLALACLGMAFLVALAWRNF